MRLHGRCTDDQLPCSSSIAYHQYRGCLLQEKHLEIPSRMRSGLTPAAVRSDPRVRRRSLREGRRLHLDWRMAAFMGLHGANRILHAGIHRILIRGIRLGATHQALPAGASVAHQVVALPPVGDGYAGAAVRMRLCGCSHDGEVAATPGRKTRF